jgi:hypothetical protein
LDITLSSTMRPESHNMMAKLWMFYMFLYRAGTVPAPESTTITATSSTPPSVDIKPNRFGYDAIPREHLDHWNNSIYILHPDDPFTHTGYVQSWHIFANRTANITFQIWRPVSNNHKFSLIGQNHFEIRTLGSQDFLVPPDKRIKFHEGDLMGVYFPQQMPISFNKHDSNCSNPTLYVHDITNPVKWKAYAFRTHESGWNPCRIYSIYAVILNMSTQHVTMTPVLTSPSTSTLPPTSPTDPPAIDIKLENGRTPHEGLVYVRAPGGAWGTVCDDDWDDKDATVICRQRGYSGGRARYPPFYGQGSGEIWMDDVQCTGNESKLVECAHVGTWGTHNCNHREDGGVECFNSNNVSNARGHVFGHPAVPRGQKDVWDQGVYIPNPSHMIPWVRGIITEWHFYIQTVQSANVALQVWRKQGHHDFFLVGQTVYQDLPPGRHDKLLIGRERISFDAGDVVGIMFSHFNPIPYDIKKGDCSDDDSVLYLAASPESVNPGRIFSFQKKETFDRTCRMYSLYAEFETSPERTSNYQFSYGLSEYIVVGDLAATQAEAIRRCKQTLGVTANLVNITSEEEYIVINRALNAMDIEGDTVFWMAGFVNDLYPGYHKWASCQPAKGKECIVLNNVERDEGTYADTLYRMHSKRCYESYKFICEIVKPGPPTEEPKMTFPGSTQFPSTSPIFSNSTPVEVTKQKTIPPGMILWWSDIWP